MKTKNLFIIIIATIVIITLLNDNQCYALTSKEDVEEYVKIIEEEHKESLKKDKMKDGRIIFGGYSSDSNENKKYISITYTGIPYEFDDNYYQMDDTVKECFQEYFDKNLDENLPDEERLLDYIISDEFLYTRKENYKNGDDIEAKIGAMVFPASEKTIWAKDSEKIYAEVYNKKNSNWLEIEGYPIKSYYIHLKMQNEKYIITYLDTVPEGYSDFVERMKIHGINLENIDYAKLINSKSETEIIAEAVQKENFEAEKIIKTKSQINLFVISVCSLGIIVTVIANIKSMKKFKKSSK